MSCNKNLEVGRAKACWQKWQLRISSVFARPLGSHSRAAFYSRAGPTGAQLNLMPARSARAFDQWPAANWSEMIIPMAAVADSEPVDISQSQLIVIQMLLMRSLNRPCQALATRVAVTATLVSIGRARIKRGEKFFSKKKQTVSGNC